MDEAVILLEVGVLVVVANLAIVAMYAKQYKRVPPGHAMVVFGRRFTGGKAQIVVSGGRFIQPIIESYAMISLEPIQVNILLEEVIANVPRDKVRRLEVSVTGLAKVSDGMDLLQVAASQLVHKSPEDIRHIIEATVEGHTRAILATEPSPELGLSKVSEKIRAAADAELAGMGIDVTSIFLKIRDTKRMSNGELEAEERITRELGRLDSRIRRIEAKLGLTPV